MIMPKRMGRSCKVRKNIDSTLLFEIQSFELVIICYFAQTLKEDD